MRTVFLLLLACSTVWLSAQNIHLSGHISHYLGNPCDEFTTQALAVPGSQGLAFALTNAQGQYDLNLEAIPTPFSVAVKPAKTDLLLTGLNAYDMVLIARHILGIQTLSNPYQIMAADINNNGQVSFSDITYMRQLILGIFTQLPDDAGWRFIPQNWVFQDPLNPFVPAFPTDIQLDNISQSVSGLDFYAIKVGDINASVCINLMQQDDRSPLALTLDDRWLTAGETVEVPLFFSENTDWVALQGSLDFDPEKLDIEAITAENLPAFDDNHWAVPQSGLLNLTWNDVQIQHLRQGQSAFTLRLRAKSSGRLSDALTAAQRGLHSEGYSDNGTTRAWALQYRQTIPATTRVLGAQPNPTRSDARLTVELAAETPIQLDVFDAAGRLTYTIQQTLPAGLQRLDIPASALPASGVYTWRVRAGEVIEAGKLVAE